MVQIRLRKESMDSTFGLYAMQSNHVRTQILWNEGTGSTVSNLRIPLIHALKVPVPPLAEQRAIAHILGTLDDKIELNRKMNETLEAMARALFKSWFVDFDPVRRNMARRGLDTPRSSSDPKGRIETPLRAAEIDALFPSEMEDSALGDGSTALTAGIPQGWRVGKLGDYANISSGKRPEARADAKSIEFPVPLYGGNGIMAYVDRPLKTTSYIITGRVGTIGTVYRVDGPTWPSDNALIIEPKESNLFELIYQNLLLVDFKGMNRGSTQPLVAQTDLLKLNFTFPESKVLTAFQNMVDTLHAKRKAAESNNTVLTVLRDTLLPKLISGELRVPALSAVEGKDAERFVGGVV